MKKILFLISLLATSFAAKIAVSIAPQEEIVKALLPNANIVTLLPAGADPHTFEPKPTLMMKIADAHLFLAIGVEAEAIWLEKIKQNSKIKIIDTSSGIEKLPYEEHAHEHHHSHKNEHEHHAHGHHHEHYHGDFDVHIWTSLKNLEQIAKNTAKVLANEFPTQSEVIFANLKKYQEKLKNADTFVQNELKDIKINAFASAHPAFRYFAKDYHLSEVSLEIEGKEIRANELAKIIELAKGKRICVILKSPIFSDKNAKILQRESKLPLVSVDALSSDITEEIMNFAKILKQNCK